MTEILYSIKIKMGFLVIRVVRRNTTIFTYIEINLIDKIQFIYANVKHQRDIYFPFSYTFNENYKSLFPLLENVNQCFFLLCSLYFISVAFSHIYVKILKGTISFVFHRCKLLVLSPVHVEFFFSLFGRKIVYCCFKSFKYDTFITRIYSF